VSSVSEHTNEATNVFTVLLLKMLIAIVTAA
jgi:hypothetical protein